MEREQLQTAHKQYMLSLYERYAGMMLGYIFEIVKNRELAEQYMVSIFKDIADHNEDIFKTDNAWCQLQHRAKVKLADFFIAVQDCNKYAVPYLNNKDTLISRMDEEQRNVFCAVYYHGKTTAELAKELDRSENEIRKTLRDAFAIIRQCSGGH